jgi:hypothetical protein
MTGESFKANLLTGAFVLVSLLAFGAILVYLQGYRPQPEGTVFVVEFDRAPGIVAGAPVRVADVPVGRVESITLRQNLAAPGANAGAPGTTAATKVQLRLRISPEHKSTFIMHRNAFAAVDSTLFGKSSLLLNPGGPGVTSDATAGLPETPFDTADADPREPRRIAGYEASSMSDVMRRAAKISDTVGDMLLEIRNLTGDPKFQADLKGMVSDLRALVNNTNEQATELKPALQQIGPAIESARKLIETIEQTVQKNSGNLDTTLKDANALIGQARDFMEKRLNGLADTLERTMNDMSKLAGNVNGMIDENRGGIRATMNNLRDTTLYLRDTAAKLRRDPSIILFGAKEKDQAADLLPGGRRSLAEEQKLRDSGALPIRERD